MKKSGEIIIRLDNFSDSLLSDEIFDDANLVHEAVQEIERLYAEIEKIKNKNSNDFYGLRKMKRTNKKCDCYSATNGKGTESIRAIAPEWANKRADGSVREFISIDPCIWPYVKSCWDNGVHTLSSCCGHGNNPKSVVVEYEHINKSINTAIDSGFDDVQIFAWKDNQIDRYY